MRARKNFQLYRGDDEIFRITLSQNGAPFNLAQIVRADLQATSEGILVLEMSSRTHQIQFIDPQNGVLVIDFNHRLTERANWRRANYDLQLIDQLGRVRTVLSGMIELTHDTTRVNYGNE